MRVLVTGGAGFIGSNVCDRLLQLGFDVLAIDNYATGVPSNNSSHRNLTTVNISICDKTNLERIFVQFAPELVIHAAASFKDPNDWKQDAETNILGTINVIECAKIYSVKKIVYLQTSLCYGLKPKETPVSLQHRVTGEGSSYAISKTAAERYIELSGLNFISLRLANIYGPRNLSGPLPSFYYCITNCKVCRIVSTRRDFVFIDDLVELIVKVIHSDKQGYYHAATGADHSIQQLFDLAASYLDAKPTAEERQMGEDDARTILLDPSKTEKDLNWKAQMSFKEGVERTIDWYRKNPLSSIYTHLKTIN